MGDARTVTTPRRTAGLVARIFIPFACGYFLSFLFRSVNAIIAPDLVAEFDLSASSLGLVTAVYFLTFAAFQLPLGLLLDRFGPRRVQSSLLLMAALGAMLFAVGQTIEVLILGRALIGLGVSGALMSGFMAFTLWFPAARLPLANACLLTFGGLGALTATTPVQWALQFTDWRGIFIALAVATAVVAVGLFLALPEVPRASRAAAGPISQFRGLARVYGNAMFWRVAPLTVVSIAGGLSLQGLWAATWLRDVGGYDQSAVAEHLLFMAVGVAVGSMVSGLSAELAERLRISLLTLWVGYAGVFMIIQLLIVLETVSISYFLWAGFGFMINALALPYAALSRAFPLELAGRVNTGLNMLMTTMTFACQYLIGGVIDLWPTTAVGGYPPQAYQVAFGGILALQVAGLLWFRAGAKKIAAEGRSAGVSP